MKVTEWGRYHVICPELLGGRVGYNVVIIEATTIAMKLEKTPGWGVGGESCCSGDEIS